MTIYPSPNYNSFVSISDATQKLTELGVIDKWNEKTDEEKEVALYLSTAMIKASCDINGGSCLFSEAQTMLIQADIVNGGKYISTKDNDKSYKKAKVGSLSIEYHPINDGSNGNSDSNGVKLPSIVKAMLSDCLKGADTYVTRGFTLC